MTERDFPRSSPPLANRIMGDLQEAADVYWLNSLEGGVACLLVDSYRDLADGVALVEALSLIEGYSASPPSYGGGTTLNATALRRALAGVEERMGRCGTVPPRLLQPPFSEKVFNGDAAACSDLVAFLRRLDELKSGTDRTAGSPTRFASHNSINGKSIGGRNGNKTSNVGKQPGGSGLASNIKSRNSNNEVGFRKAPHTTTRRTTTTKPTVAPAHARPLPPPAPRENVKRGGHEVHADFSYPSGYAPHFSKGSSSNLRCNPRGSRPLTRISEISVSGSARTPPPPPLPPRLPPPPPPEPFPQTSSMRGAPSEKGQRATRVGINRLAPQERIEYDWAASGTVRASSRPSWNSTAALDYPGSTSDVIGTVAATRRTAAAAAAAASAVKTKTRTSAEAAPARSVIGSVENPARPKRGIVGPTGVDDADPATARGIGRTVANDAADGITPLNATAVEETRRAKTTALGRARTASQAIEPGSRRYFSKVDKAKDGDSARAPGRVTQSEDTGKRRAYRREILRWMDSLGVKVDWSLLTAEGDPCHVRFSSGELLCELAAAVDYTTSGGRGLPLSEVPSCPGRFVLRGTCGVPVNAAREKHNVCAALSAFGTLGGVRGTWLRSDQAILEGDDEATWGLLGDVYARYRRLRSYGVPRSREHLENQAEQPHQHHHQYQQQQKQQKQHQQHQEQHQQHRRQQQQQHKDHQPQQRTRQPGQRQPHHQQRGTARCPSPEAATHSPGQTNNRNNTGTSLEDQSRNIPSRKVPSLGKARPPRLTVHNTRVGPERHEHGFAEGPAAITTVTDTRGSATGGLRVGWAEPLIAPRSWSAEINRPSDHAPSSIATSSMEATTSQKVRGTQFAPRMTAPSVVSTPSGDAGSTLAPGMIASATVWGCGCRCRGNGDVAVLDAVREAEASSENASRRMPSARTGSQSTSNGSHRASPEPGSVTIGPTAAAPQGTQLRDPSDRGLATPSFDHAGKAVGLTSPSIGEPVPTNGDPGQMEEAASAPAPKAEDSWGADLHRPRPAGEAASAETATWLRWDPSSSGRGTTGYVWGGCSKPPDRASLSCGARCHNSRISPHGLNGGRVEGAVSTQHAHLRPASTCVDSGRLRPEPRRRIPLFDDTSKTCWTSAAKQSDGAALIDGEPSEATRLTSERPLMLFDEVSRGKTAPSQVPGEDVFQDKLDDVGAFQGSCRLGGHRPLYDSSSCDGVVKTLLGSPGLHRDAAPVGAWMSVPVPLDPFARSLTSDLFPVAHQWAALSSV